MKRDIERTRAHIQEMECEMGVGAWAERIARIEALEHELQII